MKIVKLKLEDFLSNELVNQIGIVGGDDPTDPPQETWPRVIGGGGGDVDPKGGPYPINDPRNM
jgi:hypothetical protein